ncbi:MAG: TIGR02453 family protein [Bacteroidetes bacterium 46-16]|nr:MAG: TIGR02453 family protein [Bacteroidetes bacterium 46-16]
MLQASTLQFLEKLGKNNNKAWFDKNRDAYQAAKEDFEQFVGQVLEQLAVIDPVFGHQKAKDCIFRIFRDVRFSKDKSPYKPNFGAYFNKGGRKAHGAGYYIHLEPGKTFVGGGLWMPEGPMLKAVRQEIDYNFPEFKKIIGNAKFKKLFSKIEGEQLKTVPQGYTADNPAIEYLKLKSFVVTTKMADKDICAKTFVSKCMNVFTTMNPLVDFINRPLE